MKLFFKFCFICVSIIRKISASEQLIPEVNNLLSRVPENTLFGVETTNNHPKDLENNTNAKGDNITTQNKRYKRQEIIEENIPIIEAEDYDYITQNIKTSKELLMATTSSSDLVIEPEDYSDEYSRKNDYESPLDEDFNVDEKPEKRSDNTDFKTQINSPTIKIETDDQNDKERSQITKKSNIGIRTKNIPQRFSRTKPVDNNKENTRRRDDVIKLEVSTIKMEPEEYDYYKSDKIKTTRSSHRKYRNRFEPKSKIKRKYMKINEEDVSKNNSKTLSTNETEVLVNKNSKITNDRKETNARQFLREDSVGPSTLHQKEDNTKLETSVDNNIVKVENKSINVIDERHLQAVKESEENGRKQQNEVEKVSEDKDKINLDMKVIDKNFEQNDKGTINVNKNDTQVRGTEIEQDNNKQPTKENEKIMKTENEIKTEYISQKSPILGENNYALDGSSNSTILSKFKTNPLHEETENSKILDLPEFETEEGISGKETKLQDNAFLRTENVLEVLQPIIESKNKMFNSRSRAVDTTEYQKEEEREEEEEEGEGILKHQVLEKPVGQNSNDSDGITTILPPKVNLRDKITDISKMRTKISSQEVKNSHNLKTEGAVTKSASELTTQNLQDRTENQKILNYQVLEKPMVQHFNKNKTKIETSETVTPTLAELASRADSRERHTTPTTNKNVREQEKQGKSQSFRLHNVETQNNSLSESEMKTSVKGGINKETEETTKGIKSETDEVTNIGLRQLEKSDEDHETKNSTSLRTSETVVTEEIDKKTKEATSSIPIEEIVEPQLQLQQQILDTPTKKEESMKLPLPENVETTKQNRFETNSVEKLNSEVIEEEAIKKVKQTDDKKAEEISTKVVKKNQQMLPKNIVRMQNFPLFRKESKRIHPSNLNINEEMLESGEIRETSAFQDKKVGRMSGVKHTKKARHSFSSFSPVDTGRMSSKQSYRVNPVMRSLEDTSERIQKSRHNRKKNRSDSKILKKGSSPEQGKNKKQKQIDSTKLRQDDPGMISRLKDDIKDFQNKLKEAVQNTDSHSFTINDIQNDISFLLSDIKEIRNKFKKEEKLVESTMDLQKVEVDKLSKQVDNLEGDVKSMDENIRNYYKDISFAELQLKQVQETTKVVPEIQNSLKDLIERLEIVENSIKSIPNLETQINKLSKIPEVIEKKYGLEEKVEILSKKIDNEINLNAELQTNITSMNGTFEIKANEMNEELSLLHKNLEELGKQLETLKLENMDDQNPENDWRESFDKLEMTHNHKEAILMKNQKHLEDKLEKIIKILKIKDQLKKSYDDDDDDQKERERRSLRSLKLKNDRKKLHSRRKHHHMKKIVAEINDCVEYFKTIDVDLPPHLKKMGYHHCGVVIKAKLI